MSGGAASPRAEASGFLRLAGLVLCLAAYALLKSAFGILICDDAYITLAHARSWNAGLGPVMSAQNPVCATSTPLFTMLLAAEGALLRSSNYTVLAYFTNLFWDLAGLFFLYRIASRGLRLSAPFALAAMAAYALSVNALAVSAYGMETPMYAALALAGTWFALYAPKPLAKPALAGLVAVCFLAPLARPEGALLPVVLAFLHRTGPRKPRKVSPELRSVPVTESASPARSGRGLPDGLFDRVHVAAAAAAATGFLLFFAFNLYAYGHFLPHSILAKRLEIHVGLLEGLYSWILNVFYKGPCLGGTTATTVLNAAAIAAAALGFRRGAAPVPWGLLAWPFLYFLFFTVTGASYILFTWYYLPVLPFLILFIAAGLQALAADRLPPMAAWLGLALFLAYVPAQTFRQRLPGKHVFAEAAREGRYREAARIVDSLAAPGTAPLVMMDEVGAFGYYSRARILDSHGLLSPEVLPLLSGPVEGYYLRLAAMQDRFDPEWILGLRPVQDEGLLIPGEDGLFAGYEPFRILRLPPHPYNMEMRRRQPPD